MKDNERRFISMLSDYGFKVTFGNEFVMKGDYHFDDLPQIYVISILAGKTYKTKEYHQIGTLRNQHGEEIDNQITHVIVELGKFNLRQEEVKTDLDIVKMLASGLLSDEQIAEFQNVPLSQVQDIKRTL